MLSTLIAYCLLHINALNTDVHTGHTKKLTVVATAYDCSPEENGGYTITKWRGMPLRGGIVAVDPRVIPFGTKMWIPGYSGTKHCPGYAIAADTGGAIRGRRIDLCTNSRHWNNRWGRRRIDIILLEREKENERPKKHHHKK